MPKVKFESREELDAIILASLTVMSADYKVPDDFLNSLFSSIKIYAEGYHNLVLDGKIEAFDLDRQADKIGIDNEAIKDARKMVWDTLIKFNVIKELDEGDLYYDFEKLGQRQRKR